MLKKLSFSKYNCFENLILFIGNNFNYKKGMKEKVNVF